MQRGEPRGFPPPHVTMVLKDPGQWLVRSRIRPHRQSTAHANAQRHDGPKAPSAQGREGSQRVRLRRRQRGLDGCPSGSRKAHYPSARGDGPSSAGFLRLIQRLTLRPHANRFRRMKIVIFNPKTGQKITRQARPLEKARLRRLNSEQFCEDNAEVKSHREFRELLARRSQR